jgi:hypothetical protein
MGDGGASGFRLPEKKEAEAPSVPLHMNGGASFWWWLSPPVPPGTVSGLIVIAQTPKAEPAASLSSQHRNSESFYAKESTVH